MDTVHALTKWREEKGLTASDVGKSISCSRTTVDRYENGSRSPRQPYLDRLVILTDGAVDGNAWLGKEAADVVAKRQAFV